MNTKISLVAAALAATGIGFQANAQVLEEIIVTSQKRAQNMQDVPIAISTMSGDELTRTGLDSQRSLAQTTPNVVVNANSYYVAPYIRGVGTQYANPGLEPSVATYFNDLYMSRSSSGMMSYFDIERVEVLKGPQGTLYGRNTTGGAIRVITKDPTPEFQAGVALDIGNYEKRKYDFYVSGPLAENLMGRLSGSHEERDGYVKNIVGGPDMNNRRMGMIHGKLLWEPSERLSVKFDFDWTDKDDREGPANVGLFNDLPGQVGLAFGGVGSGGHYETAADYVGGQHLEVGGSQLRIDYDFDAFTFSSITGYRYNRYAGGADLDATSAPLLHGFAFRPGEQTEDYSQEFQLVSSNEGRIDWLAGIFILKEEAEPRIGLMGASIEADLGFPGAYIAGKGNIDIESFAPYAEVSYQLTDTLEVMAGARYTREKKKADNTFFITTIDSANGIDRPYMMVAPTTADDFKFSKTTPKVMLTWRPHDSTMFYVSYSEGVKSGGFNMPHVATTMPAEVDNETIKAWELGWKTEFDRLRFNGAIFHYDLKDLQLQVTDIAAGITSVQNAGKAEVDGIEFDVNYAFTDNLVISAGAGYQKSEFGDIPNGQLNPLCAAVYDGGPDVPNGCVPHPLFPAGLGVATVTGQLRGNELPHSPELTGYLQANYFMPLGDDMGDLMFTGLASYSDAYYYTADNLYKEPSKTLVNASVTWTSSNGMYVVSAYATNLTDKKYNTHKAPLS
ncbi:MAG: TonB-dependent receptor, partial [Tissierellales bacterium]